MLIEKIKGLKLNKPFEVTVEKIYTIKCSDLDLKGYGETKKEAIEAFKYNVLDLYEDYEMSSDTDSGKEYEERFLAYFD